MGLFFKNEQVQNEQSPERMKPGVRKAVAYLREQKANLLKPKEFPDLETILDVLTHLDVDLEDNMQGDSIIKSIAPHSMLMAQEKNSFLDAITHATIALKKAHAKLKKYWPLSLKANHEDEASLNRGGGPYNLEIPLDQESTTLGGEELQQGLAAAVLHRAHLTSVLGNTIPKDIGVKGKPDNRNGGPAGRSKSFLQDVKSKLIQVFQQPHLAHIDEPVCEPGDEYYYTHNQDLKVHQGEFVLGKNDDPLQEKVRLIRGSADGQYGYYLDLTVQECLEMDSLTLGNILQSTGKNTDQIGLQGSWYQFEKGYLLNQWTTGEPPPFSLSSGIFEKELIPAMEAAASSNAITHLSYDFGQITAIKSHVAENGASAKLEMWGIAHALQFNRLEAAPLAKHSLPATILFPAYHQAEIPSKETLSRLITDLQQAQQAKTGASTFFEDSTLLTCLKSLGLENVRLHLPDIPPENSAKLFATLKQLNDKYVAPRRAKLKEFISNNPSLSNKLDRESEEILTNLVAPEITLQDILAIALRIASGNLPVATNELPLVPSHHLSHDAIPKLKYDQAGEPILDDPAFIENLLRDKSLGLVSCNTYNLYKLLTIDWRYIKGIGAQALGGIFSPELTKFMLVRRHVSSLGSMIKKVRGKLVELIGFDTAKPDLDERLANAFSFLTQKVEGGILIRPRFRDNLNPEILNGLEISDSLDFNQRIKEVFVDLARNVTDLYERNHLFRQVNLLKHEWIYLESQFIGKSDPEKDQVKGLLTLTQMLKNLPPTYERPLQILLVAGMRQSAVKLMRKMLRLSP